MSRKTLLALLAITLAGPGNPLLADSSKYPALAQHKLPEHVKPEFIFIDELLADIKAGKKPVVVDVRTAAEFRDGHIPGSRSAPIGEFARHIRDIPQDRPVVLY